VYREVKAMDFITFNINWYKERINYYELMSSSGKCTQVCIDEAKVLHKFLEDIYDEEYQSTYNLFQEKLNATKRLEKFIYSNGQNVFVKSDKGFKYRELAYAPNEILMTEYLNSEFIISPIIKDSCQITNDGFYEIFNFSKWIYNSLDSDTAVIFLLRDTLLPYIAFKHWNHDTTKEAIPLIIGRNYLSQFGNRDELYNCICDGVYTALYDSQKTPELFQGVAVECICKSIKKNDDLYKKTKQILSNISKPKICVVESGVHGTMPLFLKCCDERIDNIKMFTTLPWLYDSWGGCFYTKRYENLRFFESLACQDLLFELSSIKDCDFYIKEIANLRIKQKSLHELSCWHNMLE